MNLRRAADRLDVTQCALARHIAAALEADLGFDVLLRLRQRLVGLTRAGELFVADAHRVLRALQDAVASGSAGRLRLGICEEAIGSKLALALQAYQTPSVVLALQHARTAQSARERKELAGSTLG